MSQNFPFPMRGVSQGNISDGFSIGTGSIWYLPTSVDMKHNASQAYAYNASGPHPNAECLGLLKENVTYNYEMTFDEISSGVPLTVKKRIIKGFKATLSAGLAELTIKSLSLFMPDMNTFSTGGSFYGELPVYTFSFVNVKPHTGGGIIINFPYATISGKVTMNFQETSIVIANLEIIAVGDTAPNLIVS